MELMDFLCGLIMSSSDHLPLIIYTRACLHASGSGTHVCNQQPEA